MLRRRLGRTLLYIFLISTSLMMAYPLLFAFAAGLTGTEDYYQSTWFPAPTEIHLDKWAAFLGRDDLRLWVANTIFRAGWYVVIPAVISVLCGYVFTVPRFKGRDAVFMLMLASMMVPGIVYVLPTFIMLARWPLVGGNDIYGQGGHGFINTWGALLIPGLINAFYIFLMRQSYQSIPRDYEEAARVDGANTLQIIWNVYVPLLRPALTVLVIFQFVAVWNDYLNPLVFAGGNEAIAPVALGAQRFIFSTSQNTRAGLIDYPTMFAVATLVTLPIVILFLLLQRYFVQGVAGFGLKG
ncbi:MAG: carbohydrate ABC transporter permease [Anaerolineae bacterium]|nr:carbohydrate ABC transporter permease [Anaerolineae bacterium]